MSDYFERVERQMVERVEAGRPRSARLAALRGHLAVAAAVAVVVAVAGVLLLARGSGGGKSSPAGHSSVSVVLSAAPAHPPAPILDRAARILRERLHSTFPGIDVTRDGRQIVVDLQNAPAGARSQILALVVPGRLAFYDWEGDVLAPNGKTVASQLRAGNPAALEISQGNGAGAPGEPATGGVSLHQALLVLPRPSTGGRFAFVEAVDRDPRQPTRPGAPNARFYVLRGVPALSGADLVDPKADTNPNTGAPAVTFGFTAAGRRAFRAVTAAVARRGALVSSPGQALNQHFAIVLDNRLITIPQIDYRQYPDGINGGGADISAGLTARTARELAILLRYGALPVDLRAAG